MFDRVSRIVRRAMLDPRFGQRGDMTSAAQKLEERPPAFLGIERSLTGRRWRTRDADLGLIEAFRRRFSLPEIAARLLAARGVSLDAAEAFLAPTLKTHFSRIE
jgi:single-stranded-DNA-specific exonuclease